MGKKDPRVDSYILKSQEFARPILEYIRETIHKACPDVEETIKWGFPHFDYKGMMKGAVWLHLNSIVHSISGKPR